MRKIKNEDIAGVIYSLQENNFEKLKNVKNPVYVKYLSRMEGKSPTKLTKGDHLFFYLSRENKSIIGHGKINNILFKKPDEIKKEFSNRIQMTDGEFDNYTKKRKSKQLLVLDLNNVTKFKNPVSLNQQITMGGQYVTKNELKNFIK